jgi:diaphanous 1
LNTITLAKELHIERHSERHIIMPDSSLTVPTILTTGTLHFVSVKPDSTAQDVIDSLVALDEVNSDILGDLDEAGWALQKIRWEESGRTWENDELEAIGDGKRALSCCRCHIV